MTTLTNEQIKANTSAVTRLNNGGCYLFKIKDTDQLWYAPASVEPKELTVVSVAVLRRMFGGYLNVGLKMNTGDRLMITSKVERGDAHTNCVQRKVYTVNNKTISVSDTPDPNITFRTVNFREDCLAKKANAEFVNWLMGNGNLVLPVANSSIMDVFMTPYDSTGFTVTKSPVYKFEAIGKTRVLTLADLILDKSGNHVIVDEGVYICFGPERKSVVIKTIGPKPKEIGIELVGKIIEQWSPSESKLGYVITSNESSLFLNIVPRALF